jgi:hypothetical protein
MNNLNNDDVNVGNNNKPFIGLKCIHYTRMVAHCKYTAMTENQKCYQQKLTVDIFISHEHNN